jgi:hypothetical protein
MRSVLIALVLTIIFAGSARADRVFLRSGGSLTGKITRETADEIDLTLEDGMRMTLRRSRISKIERSEESGSGKPPRKSPLWTPRETPPDSVEPEPQPESTARAAVPLLPGPYENSAFAAWNQDFGRYPVIMAAKNTLFRAYDLVRESALTVDPADHHYTQLIHEHGRAGKLSVWEFKYAGMQELRYGDQVRFIAELTSPTDPENMLIRLKEGDTPFAPRLAVFLVKRNGQVKRYATTTVFASADFRQEEIRRLDEYQLNVRIFEEDYVPIASTWMEPTRTEFLSGIDSRRNDSIRMRILDYRYRLAWFEAPEDKRPPLDADLLARGAMRPLARPGRPVANTDQVRRAWGSALTARTKHNELVKRLRRSLATLGIKPDRGHIVECEKVGVLGAKGVSIETRRYHFPKELLEDLLAPR